MKIILAIALAAFLPVLFIGCSKTATKPPDNSNTCNPKYPDKVVTYNNYVKNILNNRCITCHYGSGVGPGDFRTYEGVLAHVDAFPLRVLPDNADMPQGNAPLPKAVRDSLAIWIGNCTPEK